MHNALTRGEQSLPDIDAAIRAYTINAARLSPLEADAGTLEIGKFADIIVLDRDLTTIPAADIAGTQVLLTLFRGSIVHGGAPL